jgi:hypothetical protein
MSTSAATTNVVGFFSIPTRTFLVVAELYPCKSSLSPSSLPYWSVLILFLSKLAPDQDPLLSMHFLLFMPLCTTLRFCLAPKYYCEDSFQGGGWVLVRRVKQGYSWHPANDDLRGTDVYGTYGTPTSDSTFSIAWQGWGNELLLTTGSLARAMPVMSIYALRSLFFS